MHTSKTRFLSVLLLVATSPLAAAQSDKPPQSPTELFTGLELEMVAEGFTAPHNLVTPPGDSRRFVVDQVGHIKILDEDGRPRSEAFLDVSDRMVELNPNYDERGLLGLAFHPDFAENGRFFVYYSAPLRDTAPEGWNHTSHVSEFRVSQDDGQADPTSERVLLRIDQPQMNHNGGRLLFGPDGYLYIGLGDGGAAGDLGEGHPPLGNGQDVTTLLGSILRIDVNQQPYGIPEDNPLVDEQLPEDPPYAGKTPRSEIWAWGIRNSWGMSFDRQTGDLFVADVGQNLWEEVNQMKQPGNYGWRLEEGTHGFNPQDMDEVIPDGPEQGPMGEPLISPIIEHRNTSGHEEGIGVSVIGGYRYRGSDIPPLQGHYVFGDWTSGFGSASGVVIVARPPSANGPSNEEDASETEGAGGLWPIAVAIEHDQYILGFGEDAEGELYVLTNGQRGPSGDSGRVYRIVAQP